MSEHASAMAYDSILAKITLNEHRFTLEADFVQALLATSDANARHHKYHLSFEQRYQLARMGIQTNELAPRNHPHAAAKTIEDYILTQIMPHHLTEDFTVLWIKESKLHQMNIKAETAVHHMNTLVDVKDHIRYPTGQVGIPSKVSTPLLFIHDAAHHMAPADIAQIFRMSDELHTIFLTVVYPTELLVGIESENPNVYTFSKPSPDSDSFTWYPDGKTNGQYTQPLSGDWWFRYGVIYDDNTAIKIKMLETLGSHHVFMVTRKPALPETNMSFQFPSLTLLPGQDNLQLGDRLINRRFIMSMISFCFSATNLNAEILHTKARTLARDYRGEFISPYDALRASNFCIDVLKSPTLLGSGTTLASGWLAPVQKTALISAFRTLVNKPKALAAHTGMAEFKFPAYVHHIQLKPLYLSRADKLSYAFGGSAPTFCELEHLRQILLAIASGSPDRLDEILDILKVGRDGETSAQFVHNRLSLAISDFIIQTIYYMLGITLGYQVPKLILKVASALATQMLGTSYPVQALVIFTGAFTTGFSLYQILSPALVTIFSRLHKEITRRLAMPINALIRKLVDDYAPTHVKELELKINLALTISSPLIMSLDNLAKTRLVAIAQDEEPCEETPEKPMEQLEPTPESRTYPKFYPDGTPLKYELTDAGNFKKDLTLCPPGLCKSPKIYADCAVTLLAPFGVCRCAWFAGLDVRHPAKIGDRPPTVAQGWFTIDEIATVASHCGLPPTCILDRTGRLHSSGVDLDSPDAILLIRFTGPPERGHWNEIEAMIIEREQPATDNIPEESFHTISLADNNQATQLAPQGRNAGTTDSCPPIPDQDTCMIDSVAEATHTKVDALWRAFVAGLPTTGPRSATNFPRPCGHEDLELLSTITSTCLVVDRSLLGKAPIRCGDQYSQTATLLEHPRPDVNHLTCKTPVPKAHIARDLTPHTDSGVTLTKRLLAAVHGVARNYRVDYKRLDLTYNLALNYDGYAALAKDTTTLLAIHAMETSLRNSAFSPSRRKLRIGGVLGLPGTGKTYRFEEIFRDYHSRNPRSNLVSWITPLETLRTETKKCLKIQPGRGSLVQTHEVALFQNSSRIVIIDELGLFPPGWLDTFLALHPAISLVLFTGDTCQPRWTSRKTASHSLKKKPDLDLVAGFACEYLLASNRLHVDTCKALGLPCGPHSPREPTTSGGIFTTQVATASSIITGNGSREANLREASLDAFNINNVQGHTFRKTWSIELGMDTTQSNDYQAFVWCTRGRAALQVQIPTRTVTQKGTTSTELNTHIIQLHRSAIARALATGKDLPLRILQHLKANIPSRLLDPTRPPRGMNAAQVSDFLTTMADTPEPGTIRAELRKERWGRYKTSHVWLRRGKKQAKVALEYIKSGVQQLKDNLSSHMVTVMDHHRFNAMLNKMPHLTAIYSMSYSTCRAEAQHHLHSRIPRTTQTSVLPTLPKLWPTLISTKTALEKTFAHLLSLIYFPVAGSSREKLINGKWTSQVSPDNNLDAMFCRHQPVDTATVEWTIKERFIRKRDFMPGYVTTGNELFKNFLGAMKTITFCQFDETIYEDCVAEDRLRFLEKGEKRIEAISAKADPDWDPTTMQLFLKTQFITKPGCVGIEAKKGQLVLEFSTFLNQRLGPLAKYLQIMVLKMMPENVYIHAFGNENDLEAFVQGQFNFDRESLEGDFTAFDASEDECFRECVLKIMRFIKVPEHMVAEYSWLEENYQCFLGPAAVSMKSGSKMTYIVNCIVTIAYLYTRFHIPRHTAVCVSGDDSVVNHKLREKAGWPLMRKRFRIDLRLAFKTCPTFCGWRLTPGGIYKDPEILMARILHQTNRNNLFACAASYACDAQHLQNKFDSLMPYLSEAELEYHACTVRILTTALACSGQQYSGTVLQDGKFVRSYRLRE